MHKINGEYFKKKPMEQEKGIIYKHKVFGSLNVLESNNDYYFVGKELLDILGYAGDYTEVINEKFKEDESIFLNESSLYELVIDENYKDREVNKWLMDEVIKPIMARKIEKIRINSKNLEDFNSLCLKMYFKETLKELSISKDICDKNYDIIIVSNKQYICIERIDMYRIIGVPFVFIDDLFDKIDNVYLLDINKIDVVCKFVKDIKNGKVLSKEDKDICPKKDIKERTKTYIMYDNTLDLYKIGKSIDVLSRERTLMAAKPSIKCVLFCERNIESFLHKHFKSNRVRGEWFKLSPEDVLSLIEQYNFKKFSK